MSDMSYQEIMNVLIVGDVVGKPGRRACQKIIPRLREDLELDLIIVNGENIAGGSSMTHETAEELLASGADVITSGDHIFKKKEGVEVVERNPIILRPLNYPEGVPGQGMAVVTTRKGIQAAVINLMGRVFLDNLDCPFRTADRALKSVGDKAKVIIVDFHAEATSEKVALGWYLDGRVSALCGTHTHVPTADEAVLPKGTAYISDLGMTGPHYSVIGRDIHQVLHRFLTQMPGPMEVASEDVRLSGALIQVDSQTGKAKSIQRIQEKLNGTS